MTTSQPTRWECVKDTCSAPLQYCRKLEKDFGWQLLGLLVCAQAVTKGFVSAVSSAPWPYIMKAYAVPAPQMSVYEGVVALPWALKPVVGVLSDAFPIGGFAKLSYMAMVTVLGVSALGSLAFFRDSLALRQFLMLAFGVNFYSSTVDLLSEAVYAKSMRNKPESGPSLMSFVWAGIILGGTLATLVSGILIDKVSPWACFSFAVIPASFIFVPVLGNWMQDPKLTPAQQVVQQERLWQQREVVWLAFVILAATLTLTWSGMVLTLHQNAAVALVVMLFVLFCFSVSLNPVIAKVNAFGLIQTSMNLSLGGAGFYFAMDGPKEYPDGPHFSIEFFNIVLPLVGSAFTLLGIWLYQKSARTWTYQRMYIIGNLVCSLVNMIDIVYYKRWNLRIGVNDHFFVLGTSALGTMLGEWLWMPSIVLLSQLCPRGTEAIMYANLAGCHNLGQTIAADLGAILLDALNIRPSGAEGEGAQFDNLWIAAIVATVFPLLPVLLVPWFIPDKLNTEQVLERDDMMATEGSLYQRWVGAQEGGERSEAAELRGGGAPA